MATENEGFQIRGALEASVCADPTVEFVVAFGSQITGEPKGSSDIDIAIKFADDCSSRERFQKRCFYSGDLQQAETPFVDVSDIETLPLDVAHDAVNGTFVCGDEASFEQFRDALESTFAEQRDSLRRGRRDVIDRIAEDGLRG